MEGAIPRSWGSHAMALMWHIKQKSCGHDNNKTFSVVNSESRDDDDDDSSSVNVLGGLAKIFYMFSIFNLCAVAVDLILASKVSLHSN